MAKKCKRCGSLRIMNFMAKCPDGFSSEMEGSDYENPEIKGISSGECLEPSICLCCGQCQGRFPINQLPCPVTEFTEETSKGNCKTVSEFIEKVKAHDCGDKKMVACDDPRNRLVGSVCCNCGAVFEVPLSACAGLTKKMVKTFEDARLRGKFIDSLNFVK